MTDAQTATGIPGRRLPPPTFFDPTFERLPAAAAFDGEQPGPVLLLFDPRADRAWVADAAIALATGWNAAGRRTVLADLSIEDPILHERVGVPNLDGVVDLFLYGASLARSARPVPGRGFLLITAGTYTPDPEAILRHPRWEKIVAGFREAQASLLLFVPLDAPELASIGRWASDVVVLGERGDGELFESIIPPDFRLRAWLTPPARPGSEPPRAAAPAPSVERFQPEPAASAQPWTAPPREPAPPRPADTLPSGDATAYVPAAQLPVPDPEWEATVEPEPWTGKRRKTIPKERKLSPVMLVLLVLLFIVLAAVAAVTFLPGLLPGWERPATAPASNARLPGRRPQAAARPAGTARPYSVYVRAFQGDRGYDAAVQLAKRVESGFPGTSAYVFPEEISGMIYYKVYAGMLDDTVQAAALRTQLVGARLANPDDVGGPAALIQARPWTFDLGAFPTREAADRRAAELATAAIYVSPTAVPQSDGTERWTLYAGAYPDSARAEPMKKTLQTARLPARLVQRVGRAPATSK
ncbi:Sporulation related domain-containing protein [bacterium JGI 053]|nr:Sporulation related domain-containing protein [bacterium JGI 053]